MALCVAEIADLVGVLNVLSFKMFGSLLKLPVSKCAGELN